MQKIKNNGSALSQYGIIIVLVSIAIVPLVYFTGGYIVKSFEDFYHLLNPDKTISNNSQYSNSLTNTSNSNNSSNTINNSEKTGEITSETKQSGFKDQPSITCKNSLCTIDYGEFVLNGVPEDFGSFVESNGSSGGTDSIATILKQIAEQLKEKGDTQGYQDYLQLAELAHLMASNEKIHENIAESCIKDTQQPSCFTTQLNIASLPDSLANILTTYSTDKAKQELFEGTYFGYEKYNKVNYPEEFEKRKKAVPEAAAVDIFDRIMNKSNYSQDLKNLTTKLYNNINDLSLTHKVMLYGIKGAEGVDKNPAPDLQQANYDALTGKEIPLNYKGDTTKVTFQDLIHPKTSKNTNLKAAMICVAGKNYDNGEECNKK